MAKRGRKPTYFTLPEKVKKEKPAPVVEAPSTEVPHVSKVGEIDWANVSEEELAKLVADYTKQDPYKLKGLNPAFRYRFLNRSEDRLNKQTMRGWVIVTGTEAKNLAEVNKIETRQGQIIVGDGVLAKIPMQMFIAIRARLEQLNRRAIGKSSATLRRDIGDKYSRNVEESLKTRVGSRQETII